jgi:hypothetical protein
VLVLLPAAGAQADEIERNGQPLNVTIVGVDDGELVYRPAAGGERRIPLDEVGPLKLDTDPKFFDAYERFVAEDYRGAVDGFGEVIEESSAPWVRHYARFYLAQALDQRGEPTDAAEVYLAIARDGADPYFLSRPPVASLADANDAQRGRIRSEIMAVIEDTEGPARAALQGYLRQVVGDDQMPDIDPGPGPGPGTPGAGPDRTASAVILPDEVWDLLDEDEAEERWAAVTLLIEGDPAGAVEAITPWLDNPSAMPQKLFILGRAQLAIAEATGERDDYLDAGLTFMRLIVHYKPGTTTLIAPARLEVALVHRAIGREDLYEKLLFDDGLSLSFADDPETYPQYYRRYYQIIDEPLPTPDDDAPQE